MTDISSVRLLARHELFSREGLTGRLPHLLTLHKPETLLDALRSQRIFLTIVVAYLVCGLGAAAALGRSINFNIGVEPASLVLSILSIGMIAACLQFIRIRLVMRSEQPLAEAQHVALERLEELPESLRIAALGLLSEAPDPPVVQRHSS